MQTLRRTYDPTTLLRAHPPKLKHPHKRLVFEMACPPTATYRGTIELTRWAEASVPDEIVATAPEVIAEDGFYTYDDTPGVWHVNFADPQLFVAYGSGLLAQDELQAAEHPVLGSLREALLAERLPALTEENGRPTPVLVAGVERRCAIATDPDLDAGRFEGLYGNRFARADAAVVRRAVRVLEPPTRSNLVAIAAPGGGRGPYFRADLERILVTAYTGFAAAAGESRRMWPAAPVEIRTGFWGCGAFGGNRRAMTVLQLLAARQAGVDRVRFYVADARGRADFDAAAADLAQALAPRLADVMERIDDLDYEWGVSDGN